MCNHECTRSFLFFSPWCQRSISLKRVQLLCRIMQNYKWPGDLNVGLWLFKWWLKIFSLPPIYLPRPKGVLGTQPLSHGKNLPGLLWRVLRIKMLNIQAIFQRIPLLNKSSLKRLSKYSATHWWTECSLFLTYLCKSLRWRLTFSLQDKVGIGGSFNHIVWI